MFGNSFPNYYAVIDLKNTTIKFVDGAGTPNTITLNIGDGNITFSEKRNVEYRMNRGKLSGGKVRLGDEVPVDVSMDIEWEFLRSDSGGGEPVTPEEALKGVGAASGWTTTGADACEPYCIDIHIENLITCGSVKDERIVFSEFRYEEINHDPKAGTLSVTGKCNEVSPTVTRLDI